MPQTSCFQEIFVSSGNQVLGNENAALLTFVHGIQYELSDNGRPFIPFCGAVLNANGVYVPDTVVNNQTQIATFALLFKECRQASINFVQQGLVVNPVISQALDSPTAGYLYKKTFSQPSALNRYLQNAGMIFDFWTGANPAWTATEYYNALMNLKNNIHAQASKDLYIPNNTYTFGDTTALDIAINAWKAANANLAAFLCVEMYQ